MSEVPLHLLEARGDEAAELGARGQVVQDRPERFQPLQCQTRLSVSYERGTPVPGEREGGFLRAKYTCTRAESVPARARGQVVEDRPERFQPLVYRQVCLVP